MKKCSKSICKNIDNKQKTDYLFHSNMIEEIQLSKELYKGLTNSRYAEISGHANALEYMLEHYKEDLSEKHILNMHGLLMKGLVNPKYCGAYRNIPIYIGGHEALQSIIIKPAMERLIRKSKMIKTEKDCLDLHNNYEYIHGFVDGNGRSGRLLLNWARLHNGFTFKIISSEDKERFAYYDQISETPFDLMEEKYDAKEDNE